MIHPQTELRHVNPEIGVGVFATAAIPKGTLVYVKDALDIELTADQLAQLEPVSRKLAEKYAYIDERGIRIVSWDHAKYVNHRCACNTISTGYGFEIALRNIAPGEEITDDYGLFNIRAPFAVSCGCPHCRKVVQASDLDHYADVWDAQVRSALQLVRAVTQPLWELVDPGTLAALNSYLAGQQPYRSVRTLKWNEALPPADPPQLRALA
jgi:uncharacterized protein